MLLRGTRPDRKQLVATRTVAGTIWKFFRNVGCALALAPPVVGFRGHGGSFPPPLSISATLFPPPFFPLRTRPIPLRRTPPPPAARRLPALRTAIPRLRTHRLKPALTSLQQTPPAARRPGGVAPCVLTRIPSAPRLTEIHGSWLLPSDPASGRSSQLSPEALSPPHPLQSTPLPLP